ncbi:MAG TPA: hypothetical protein VHF25_06985 [Nitriliruptorales bacterium]|nr:hypothetical protein [Nitriliruptorales bacterium]
MPAITRFYGVTPRQVEEDFTADELGEYLLQMDEHRRAEEKAAAEAEQQARRRR